MRRLWWIITIAVMVVACGGHKARHQSVWELYDVRYPVPAGSKVPVSRATIYNRYNTPVQPYPADNDSFYKQPVGLGSSPDDILIFN